MHERAALQPSTIRRLSIDAGRLTLLLYALLFVYSTSVACKIVSKKKSKNDARAATQSKVTRKRNSVAESIKISTSHLSVN